MLVRCLYASRVTTGSSETVMREILTKSRLNNINNGITGVLIGTEDCFVQILEGGRSQVCKTYNAIAADKRHFDVTLMMFEEIFSRSFEGWSMGEVAATKINPALLLKHSATSKLDPFSMSSQAMLALLSELVSGGTVTAGNAQRPR